MRSMPATFRWCTSAVRKCACPLARATSIRGGGNPQTLPAREEPVRGRADRDALDDVVRVAPDVEANGVRPQRQVEREHLAALLAALGHGAQLPVNRPLGELVVADRRTIDVGGLDVAVSQPRRPLAPLGAVALTGGAEPRVLRDRRSVREERGKRLGAVRAHRAELGGEHLEHAALRSQRARPVDERVRARGCRAKRRSQLVGHRLRRLAVPESVDGIHVQPPVVPEPPADRQVGAGLEVRGAEPGEEREGGDHAGSVARDGRCEQVEVAEVAAPPAVLAVEREEGAETPIARQSSSNRPLAAPGGRASTSAWRSLFETRTVRPW